MNSFYITTALPYVNSDPHIGFALEIIRADAIARYHILLGDDVVFNTGTDEHGLKIHRKAGEQGITTQAYVDEYSKKFKTLKETLNLSYTNFIRTTDEYHKKAAQEFWKLCCNNGDIYKKKYQVKYCVGCELEKTDSELVDGKCEFHPTYEIEFIDEENYFFKFSAYQEKLLKLYEQKDFVVPEHRLNEIRSFVGRGLEDFSISRLKEKMPWGVEVPGDESQVMYVWFDALVNYISTLGWPENKENFERFWPGIQLAGKDNLRQQSAMWQAMLMSANLPPSKQIFIGGFITSEGQKMSKSIGNVIAPFDVVEKYGTDPVRYFLLGGISAYADGDWSTERFEKFYTAHLANGIGNLTSRVITMLEKYSDSVVPIGGTQFFDTNELWGVYYDGFNLFKFDDVVEHIQRYVGKLDKLINDTKPWEMVRRGEDVSDILYILAESLRIIAIALIPIIPKTAEKILKQLGIDINKLDFFEVESKWGRLIAGSKVEKTDPLFPKLER